MKELKQFDKATDKLADAFVIKYFGEEYESYWIGSEDEDKEVLAVGDYFFNLEDIVNFIRYKHTKKEMFEYYNYASEKSYREAGINIKNYRKLRK